MKVDTKDLKVGDVIEVWWKPRRDTILTLKPYTGPLAEIAGARIATFAQNTTGMTIEPDSEYEVLNREAL